MTDEEMAEEYIDEHSPCFKEYPKAPRGALKQAFLAGLKAGKPKWHNVADGDLPELDVLVYLWNNVDDFPVVGRRHIPYGAEKWIWDCKWGSGYTVSQSAGKDYLWKEIVPPKEVESD